MYNEDIILGKLRKNREQLENMAKQNRNLASTIMGSVLDGKESVNINVVGDSTGNDSTEWVYLLGQKIASQTDKYNVNYYAFSEANGKYNAPIYIKNIGEKRKLISNNKAVYVHEMDSHLVPVAADMHDIDVRLKLKTSEWATGTNRTLLSKDGGGDGSRCWRIGLYTNNQFNFIYTADGTSTTIVSMGYVDGASTLPTDIEVYLRFVFDADNGSGSKTFKVYRSTDDGATWVQLGTTITQAGVATRFKNDNINYQVFGYANAANMLGEMYSIEIMDSIDGINIAPRSIEAFARIADSSSQSIEGTPEINIWNGSLPGYGLDDFLANNLARKLVVNNIRPIIFTSTSHNESFVTNYVLNTLWDSLLLLVKQYAFYPTICLLTQNPEGESYVRSKAHVQRRRELIQYAKYNNYNFIDVYQAFINYANAGGDIYDLIKVDNIHPTEQGSELWKETVWKNISLSQ